LFRCADELRNHKVLTLLWTKGVEEPEDGVFQSKFLVIRT
jgi:hypothetical protein